MSGFWMIFWLAVVLKLPIAGLFWLVWWASREPELPEPEPDSRDGGGSDRGPHPRTGPPRPPRRGPHAVPEPRAPARTRAARGRHGLVR